MSKIKKTVDNIFRIPGSATIEEIYQATGGKQLPVEPFSTKQTITEFILEGGTGYNSLLNGSLGEYIYEIKARYSGKSFTYGLPFSTLYATGYPLQRIIEGSKRTTLIKQFDRIDWITLPLSGNTETALLWKKTPYTALEFPPFSINAHFLNPSAAKLFGMKDEGFCVVLPKGTEEGIDGWESLESSVWENRFFMEKLNDSSVMTVFTQLSTSLAMHDVFKDKKISGIFAAVFAKKGVLVKVTGTEDELQMLWEGIKDQDHTYKLG